MQVDMDTVLENPVESHDTIEQPPPLPPKVAKECNEIDMLCH